MYPEIVRSPHFYLDKQGQFFSEAITFILTGEHFRYLYNIFHSKYLLISLSTSMQVEDWENRTNIIQLNSSDEMHTILNVYALIYFCKLFNGCNSIPYDFWLIKSLH